MQLHGRLVLRQVHAVSRPCSARAHFPKLVFVHTLETQENPFWHTKPQDPTLQGQSVCRQYPSLTITSNADEHFARALRMHALSLIQGIIQRSTLTEQQDPGSAPRTSSAEAMIQRPWGPTDTREDHHLQMGTAQRRAGKASYFWVESGQGG